MKVLDFIHYVLYAAIWDLTLLLRLTATSIVAAKIEAGWIIPAPIIPE